MAIEEQTPRQEEDYHFLREAIRLAGEKMRAKEGGPFGALVVMGGREIARGWNRVTSSNDPTAHAEIVAIREACRKMGDFSLAGATLYVNCEPCPMCLAACYWAGVEAIVYAATREDAAAIGFADAFLHAELCRPPAHRALPLRQLLHQEALSVFREWEAMEDKTMY